MREVIERWENYLKVEKGLLPNTRKLYRRTLEEVQDNVGNLSDLTTNDIRRWLHRRGGSPSSVSNRISALRSFYRFLVKTGERVDEPTAPLEPPQRPDREPEPVHDLPEVLDRLDELDKKANASGAVARRVGQTRDMAVFLANTGMRINEAVACEWPVPCPPQVIVVGRGHKEQTLEVRDEAREAWDRLDGRWPCGARATQRRFEKAGFHPHQLRHWYAINIAGAPQPRKAAAPRSIPRPTATELNGLAATLTDDELEVVVRFLSELLDHRRVEGPGS